MCWNNGSFWNWPDAVDDVFKVSEDAASGVMYLDVLANDKSSTGKSLWSIDNGQPWDLLCPDGVRTEATSCDKSALGATVWITSSGKIGYSTAAISGLIQSLSAGQTLTDSFVYAMRSGNGLFDWATAKIVYCGANDGVTITSGPAAGTVIEDTQPATGGTIGFTDVDLADTHTASFTAGPNATNYGTFSLGAVNEAPNAASGTVGWNYTLNASAQAMAQGETFVETFLVKVSDGTVSATQTVTVTIQGTNDAPVAQGAAASVLEDQLVTGKVQATDIDHGASLTYSVPSAPAGFAMAADGSWSFDAGNAAYQHLGAGETQQLVVNYVATDEFGATGTEKIVITVTGVNDAAVIGGDVSGKVVESAPGKPGTPVATGTLTVSDADDGQASFRPQNAAPTASGYGTFAIDASGHWTYTVDNSNPEVNGLPDGGKLTDTITVQSADGTSQTISITIYGADDFVGPNVYTGADDPNDFDGLVGTGASNNSSVITGSNTAADNITGGDAGQSIDGKGGSDFIYAGGGDDTVIGNAGDDTLYGQAGNDTMTGNSGLDGMYGGSGNDGINGGNDADLMYGGSGNDNLSGGAGDDILVGGFGRDGMTGGLGADTFIMLDVRDTNDFITDFQFGTDRLDLQAIDANSNAGGDQAFAWGGDQATAYGLWFKQAGADLIVYADTDGNTDTAEFMVTLNNVTYGAPLTSPPADILF